MSENKKVKCDYNCVTCQHRNKEKDFCMIKQIENCSKVAPTEFSKCADYMISDKLIMF